MLHGAEEGMPVTPFSFDVKSHPAPLYFLRLQQLLAQPEPALERLLDIARTSPGVGSFEEIDDLVATVRGADPHVLYGALAGVGTIVRDIPEEGVAPGEIFEALLTLAPEDVTQAMTEKRPFLLNLFEALLARRDDLAIRVLRSGPGEVVRSVETSVTLAAAMRPDDSIAGYLPVAIVRVDTDREYLVLQFDESRLAQFVQDIEAVARKLAALRSHTDGPLPVSPPVDYPRG